MYKATVLFGRELARKYWDTRKIPTHYKDGSIETKEFKTQAEMKAYSLGLSDAEGYDGETVFIPEKDFTPTVICTRCGGTNVSCGGVVNPNTCQSLDLADRAFYDGHCEKCGFTILSDIEYTLQSIEERYTAYKKINQGEPSYAQCEISYCEGGPDDINQAKLMIFKLNPEVIEKEDDNIYFYCQNYEELKTFIRPADGRDFVIIDCQDIY